MAAEWEVAAGERRHLPRQLLVAAVLHLPGAERVQGGGEPKACWVGSHHSDGGTVPWHVLRSAPRLLWAL